MNPMKYNTEQAERKFRRNSMLQNVKSFHRNDSEPTQTHHIHCILRVFMHKKIDLLAIVRLSKFEILDECSLMHTHTLTPDNHM